MTCSAAIFSRTTAIQQPRMPGVVAIGCPVAPVPARAGAVVPFGAAADPHRLLTPGILTPGTVGHRTASRQVRRVGGIRAIASVAVRVHGAAAAMVLGTPIATVAAALPATRQPATWWQAGPAQAVGLRRPSSGIHRSRRLPRRRRAVIKDRLRRSATWSTTWSPTTTIW